MSATDSRPRPSLRELAERAKHSQASRPAPSVPPSTRAAPDDCAVASRPPPLSSVPPTASTVPPAALDTAQSAAVAAEVSGAAAADDRPRWRGASAGFSIGLLGVAAALWIRTTHAHGVPALERGGPVLAAAGTRAASGEAAPPAAAPVAPLPAARSAGAEPARAPQEAAPKQLPSSGAAAVAARAEPASDPKRVSPQAPGEEDLASAMRRAVGDAERSPGGAEGVAVKDEHTGADRGSVPEQPPQGSVQAALRPLVGAARACVAGADEASRAAVTFSSSGAVSGVVVSGWASAHGAGSCIESALKGAHVGPFGKPSYTVSVVVRP